MSAARLLEPAPHVDPALHQGQVIGDRCVAGIRVGASDPDALMRVLLRVLADNGNMVPPTSLLRGFCMAVQRGLSGGAGDATTE